MPQTVHGQLVKHAASHLVSNGWRGDGVYNFILDAELMNPDFKLFMAGSQDDLISQLESYLKNINVDRETDTEWSLVYAGPKTIPVKI